jgi:tetratricopeptide (TPR) repeat protein
MNKFLPVWMMLFVLMAADAFAQGGPGYKGHSHEKPNIAKPKNAPQASERELADVILADALESLWLKSDDHFHRGEWNHTINLSRLIAQGEPDRVEIYSNSAWLLWSSDRNEQAIAFLKQGIAANPNSYYLLDEMGMHYAINLKQPAAAIPYYERVMKLKDRKQTYTVHNLARCYERTNQLEKALKTWEIAVNMPLTPSAPRNTVAENGIKRVKALLAKKM